MVTSVEYRLKDGTSITIKVKGKLRRNDADYLYLKKVKKAFKSL